MSFPPTSGSDAKSLLANAAISQGIASSLPREDVLALIVANLLKESPTDAVTTAAILANAVTEAKLATALAGSADGLGLMRVARATFDPSATAGMRTVAPHGLGVTLPISAIICGGFLVVHTAFTSGGSTAQIAFHAQSANDLISAAAVSGSPYSTIGRKAIVPKANTPESTSIELTAARELTATVSVEALTAGKATLFVYYVVGAVSA